MKGNAHKDLGAKVSLSKEATEGVQNEVRGDEERWETVVMETKDRPPKGSKAGLNRPG